MLALAAGASLAEPPTSRLAGFGVDDAYAVAREKLAQRERAGWRRIGRKVGFTNRTIWEQYGVYQPIFGYLYAETVRTADGASGRYEASLPLAGLVQPRIEPEIVLGLRAPPPLSRDPLELLRAIEWVGHGFEVVHCHFPGWRFAVADTIADGGLHGRYVVGPRVAVEAGSEREWAERLASFRIVLEKDGEPAARGGGALVLDSPLNALAALVEVLSALPDHPPLARGELITTGTLTAALPIAPGEAWSTRIEGLALPGLRLRLE
jgi:2-oxo-3-hexenedioate decarboxylase